MADYIYDAETGADQPDTDGDATETEVFEASGVVKYLNLEGGFWAIETAEGGLDAVRPGIPSEFRVVGLNVKLTYTIAHGWVSSHMWGTLINIVTIEEIESGGSDGGSSSSWPLANYPLIKYNGSVVRQLQLNGTKVYQQSNSSIDVNLGWGHSPLDRNGKLSIELLKYLKFANPGVVPTIAGSSSHFYCFVYAPNGKIGGYGGGIDIQQFKLRWKITTPRGTGGAWMRGGQTGYFQSEVGKEGRKETCGSCYNPLTGWIRMDSRQKGYTSHWGSYWFSSFRLHDGNSNQDNCQIEVFPDEYAFYPNENQNIMKFKLRG
jgi:hypothetical protein